MTTLFILVRVCRLGSKCFIGWRCLECSWAPLSFALHVLAKSLCFCLCLFDAIVDLHAMAEKMSNDLSLESDSEFHVIKTHLIHDLYLVEAFATLNRKT